MIDLKANLMAKHNDNGCGLGGRYRTSMEMQKMQIYSIGLKQGCQILGMVGGQMFYQNSWWPNKIYKKLHLTNSLE